MRGWGREERRQSDVSAYSRAGRKNRNTPDLVDGEEEFEVEKIIDMKQMGRGRKTYYLVKWKGYPTSDNSWEPRENIHADELIKEFQNRAQKTNKDKGRRKIKG